MLPPALKREEGMVRYRHEVLAETCPAKQHPAPLRWQMAQIRALISDGSFNPYIAI